ncbi:MAG: hypothetical protein IJP66_00275 [Kiritimatiellae bacterium]|nr:hypothetical protein [Kiritimatiellia bacterium]
MNKPSIAVKALCAAVVCAAATFLSACARKPAPRRAYAPLAPEGTLVAAVSETKGLATNPMALFLQDFNASAGEALFDAVQASGLEPPREKPDFEAAKKRGIENCAKVNWTAFTMAKPAFEIRDVSGDEPFDFPAVALVYSLVEPSSIAKIEGDLKKDLALVLASADKEAISRVREFFDANFTIADDSAAGVPVRKLQAKPEGDAAGALQMVRGLEPCYGVFDASLLIFASSPRVFADTVALYSGNAPTTTDALVAADLALGGKAQSRCGIYGVADFLKDFVGEFVIDGIDEEPRKFVKSLRNLRFSSTLDGEAMSATFSLCASFDDETLAPALSSLASGAKGMAAFMAAPITAEKPALAPFMNIFNSLAVKAEGDSTIVELTATKADIEAIDPVAIFSQCGVLGLDADDEDDEADDDSDDDDDDDDEE